METAATSLRGYRAWSDPRVAPSTTGSQQPNPDPSPSPDWRAATAFTKALARPDDISAPHVGRWRLLQFWIGGASAHRSVAATGHLCERRGKSVAPAACFAEALTVALRGQVFVSKRPGPNTSAGRSSSSRCSDPTFSVSPCLTRSRPGRTNARGGRRTWPVGARDPDRAALSPSAKDRSQRERRSAEGDGAACRREGAMTSQEREVVHLVDNASRRDR